VGEPDRPAEHVRPHSNRRATRANDSTESRSQNGRGGSGLRRDILYLLPVFLGHLLRALKGRRAKRHQSDAPLSTVRPPQGQRTFRRFAAMTRPRRAAARNVVVAVRCPARRSVRSRRAPAASGALPLATPGRVRCPCGVDRGRVQLSGVLANVDRSGRPGRAAAGRAACHRRWVRSRVWTSRRPRWSEAQRPCARRVGRAIRRVGRRCCGARRPAG
jgi:hypothetical protein